MSTAAGSSPAGTVATLQAALAAEQAAAYGYGVVGSRLPQGSAAQAMAGNDWVAHLRVIDELTAMIRGRGATPVSAAVAYQLPLSVQSAPQAHALAALLEDRLTQTYLAVVALPEGGLRTFGAEQVRATALRAEAWRGTTEAFPGLTPAG